jgi:hypothetical protein
LFGLFQKTKNSPFLSFSCLILRGTSPHMVHGAATDGVNGAQMVTDAASGDFQETMRPDQ